MKLWSILAKPNVTLYQHIEDVLVIFSEIRQTFPDIPKVVQKENFWEILFYSIFLHDFGKAATGWQEELKAGYKIKPWNYRHEILSASFIKYVNLDLESKQAIGWAIITHHKDEMKINNYNTKSIIKNHPELNPNLQKFREKANELIDNWDELIEIINKIPDLSEKYLDYRIESFNLPPKKYELSGKIENHIEDFFEFGFNPLIEKELHLEEVSLFKILGIFLRGLIISCDHLASGGLKKVLPIPQIFFERTNQIVYGKEKFIQKKIQEVKGNSIIIAPTASGKTEASFLWAQKQLEEQSGRPRLIYILPYTASINAMFLRISKMCFIPKTINPVVMLHYRAFYILNSFYQEDSLLNSADNKIKEIWNLSKKIFMPIKIITPFQILKAFFGIKGFEIRLTELQNSLIIIDEIHIYEERNLANIIGMIIFIVEKLKGKFLIMSATVPSKILEMLKEKFSIENEVRPLENELRGIKRHKINILSGGIIESLMLVSDWIKNGKRVLIVVNSINTSQIVYREIKKISKNAVLLHSHFTLIDRSKIEKKILKDIVEKRIDILVGTQAIEISLNISFDILLSEPAPIDALIQRLGRVNRFGEQLTPADVYIVEKGSKYDHLIYEDQNSVSKTMKLLRNTPEPNEWMWQKLIDEVYESTISEKIKNVKIYIDQFLDLSSYLRPFKESKFNEEYFEMFDSVELIPKHFLVEIQQKTYFTILRLQSLTISISNQ